MQSFYLRFCKNGMFWLFQLALPTFGDPKWRRNINGTGWSAWWTLATA